MKKFKENVAIVIFVMLVLIGMWIAISSLIQNLK